MSDKSTKNLKELALKRDALMGSVLNREMKLIEKTVSDKADEQIQIKRWDEKKIRPKRKINMDEVLKKEKEIDLKISKEEIDSKKKIPKKILQKRSSSLNEVLKKEKEIDLKISKKSFNHKIKALKNILKKRRPKKVSQKRRPSINEVLKKEKAIDLKISKEEIYSKKKTPKRILKKEKAIDLKISKDKINQDSLDKDKLMKDILFHQKNLERLRKEISRIVVGHEEVINGIIRSFLANGHVLIEGVPGIAKTLLIRTLAHVSGCEFSRIQFTVDLLPTDITGVTTYNEKTSEFTTMKGPIFANFIIADEINRAPPKSQSSLLEAMQEKQVTIGNETHKVPNPFFVMANNNPLESSGTYPLPEAQVDRFLFKLKMGYTSNENEEQIIDTNITINNFEDFGVKKIISPGEILRMQKSTKKIIASPSIKKYIVKIVDATRNPQKYGILLGKYIDWGGSPRASIGLTIAAKADAMMKGFIYITPQNVKNVAHDVLRHRLILGYEGQAKKINTDDIITEILNKVPIS